MNFKLFIGELVRIMTTVQISMTMETERGTNVQSRPLDFSGYVLDEDKTTLFLGDTPHEVTFAVNKNNIVLCEIAKPTPDHYDDLMGASGPSDFNN